MTRKLYCGMFVSSVLFAQTGWLPTATIRAMRYSSLRQINAGNVERLQLAWTFHRKPGSNSTRRRLRRHIYPGSRWCLRVGPGNRRTCRLTPNLWPCAALLYGPVRAVSIPGCSPEMVSICWRLTSPLAASPRPASANEGRRRPEEAGVLGDLKDARYVLQSPPAVYRRHYHHRMQQWRGLRPPAGPMATYAV